jgi:hypothetical protein
MMAAPAVRNASFELRGLAVEFIVGYPEPEA